MKIQEILDPMGNRGSDSSRYTDHTYDEATKYLKQHYPLTKSYKVARIEPGFRAVNFSKNAKTMMVGNLPIDPAVLRRSEAAHNSVDSAIKALQLQQNGAMSGSKQVTYSIGYSWHLFENLELGVGLLYYEDRGMGSDQVTVGAQDKATLQQVRAVLIQAGVLKDPAEIKAARERKAAARAPKDQ